MTKRENVLLRGGPMDGWLVTPEAPVLGPDWPGVEGQPGAYGAPYRGKRIMLADWVAGGVSGDEGEVSGQEPPYLAAVSGEEGT